AFLAWSSLATKQALAGDGRSLHFPAGLAEGTETILAYLIVLLMPGRTALVLWIWAAVVGVTVVQRLVFVTRTLAEAPSGAGHRLRGRGRSQYQGVRGRR
ncbi:MAG: hypothetical protein OEV40_19320, partial [Acidimicrobiia bacterium]|nr:hypothetical protein [Acidimicrobiia bacterium]